MKANYELNKKVIDNILNDVTNKTVKCEKTEDGVAFSVKKHSFGKLTILIENKITVFYRIQHSVHRERIIFL